ncbi:MAG: hypothetical protein Q8N18_23750 [Opitutaceae bacterium]|nr:hypothetical protein [Opitutaceae bacterium]
MNIKLGPPVSDDNFYPRPELIGRILRALEHAHVAFLGPRRTGKTSCLRHILGTPPTGYVPILINLEQFDSVEAWLRAMLEQVRLELEKPGPKAPWLVEKSTNFLKRIEQITIAGSGLKLSPAAGKSAAWRAQADEFLGLLKETNAPVIFLLDEFPVFLNLVARKRGKEEVEALLNWFRAARQDLVNHAPRFLVTGSIGLKGVVRRLGLAPTINDFDTLEIPPLSDAEARDFLKTLARDNAVPLTAPGGRHILRLLGGPWPILLQLFVSEIREAQLKKAPTTAQLDRIYRDGLVGGPRNEYCAGMFTRLKDVFSPSECRLAQEILKALCRADAGLSREDFDSIHAKLVPLPEQRALHADELDYVLDALKHDGYLRQESEGEQRTHFASHILRDFWRRKTS